MNHHVKRYLAVFICLLLCAGQTNAESITETFSCFHGIQREPAAWNKRDYRIVGTDIEKEDITEFYYTYATSTNPPVYQRYHYYVEDGAYFFYHETRTGDHWPLTEADITGSGTVKLTEEEWETFFGQLCGGQVKKREESDETGAPGPWLYLYWNGDDSEYQAFSFASGSKEASFGAACAKLAESGSLAEEPGKMILCSFSVFGGMENTSYSLTLMMGDEEDAPAVVEQSIREGDEEVTTTYSASRNALQDLQGYIEQYAPEKWSELPFSEYIALDAPTRMVYVLYEDGTGYTITDDLDLPEGSGSLFDDVRRFLESDAVDHPQSF